MVWIRLYSSMMEAAEDSMVDSWRSEEVKGGKEKTVSSSLIEGRKSEADLGSLGLQDSFDSFQLVLFFEVLCLSRKKKDEGSVIGGSVELERKGGRRTRRTGSSTSRARYSISDSSVFRDSDEKRS